MDDAIDVASRRADNQMYARRIAWNEVALVGYSGACSYAACSRRAPAQTSIAAKASKILRIWGGLYG